ncbi:MAG: flagellar biosynthesis regulator FlaF [Mangrovicoccus sp.]|nr:flagellar biosynthesis regulator FlaF [Mangrovicoccus sp.]
MNAVERAQTAYGSVRAPIRTPRSVEYEAIARITRNLNHAMQRKRENYAALANALHENRRLWTLLGTNITDEDNELPAELRLRLSYLADFCISHTSKVLRDDADAKILVDINLAVMGGLRNPGSAP